jgi:4-hydroxy-tetrahydrodipicolinate synthase
MPLEHRGVYAAPLMPLRDDLSADLPKYIAHCGNLLEAGCQGLMPIGSTGEGHSFTVEERIETMDALAESGLPTERMLIGTSALAFPDAVRLVKHAVSIGAGGACVQPPFYYKPAETVGLIDFFSRVIDGVNDPRLRLYVYDWEANLSVHHSLDFFHRLFEAYPDNAIGIKDSSGVPDMLEERCRAFPDKDVFAGTDGMTLTCLRAGGNGIMSGISNIVPDVTTALHAGFEGETGERMQARVGEIRAAMGDLPWFSALRATMAWLSGDPSWRTARPAIRRLSEAEEVILHDSLTKIGLTSTQLAAE